ncbi:MAG: NAD(P)-binding protein [Proteobacteria bacterium]|nr:NAD(P)-binding protein [Pseudomonadota bacterium]
MASLAELESQAFQIVSAVAEDPQGRLQVREDFYAEFGFAELEASGEGFGRAEIDFLEWEIRRGVLNPLTAEQPGSRWWRQVQQEFSRVSVFAGLVQRHGLQDDGGLSSSVEHWLAYFAHPSPQTFYKAHNHGIVAAYAAAEPVAHLESADEQFFLNEVLYRLVFAQALVEGEVAGIIGEVAADPRLFSVDFITHLHALYPTHYPMTPREVRFVHHEGISPEVLLARVLDVEMILPHITELYEWAAQLNGSPELPRQLVDGQPVYPNQPKPPPEKPKKIAVLGGGMSALAAVHELTRYPDWKLHYDITVYQLGWRLGGKAATGRGPNDRIEERGLHIMQGWYDNAWRLIQQVYAEREQRGLAPNTPYPTWEEAFLRNDATILTEWIIEQGGWVDWPLVFPKSSQVPGSAGPDPIWDQIKKLIGLALELVLGSPYARHISPLAKEILDRFFPADDMQSATGLWGLISKVEHVAEELVERVLGPLDRAVEDALKSAVGELLEELGKDEVGAEVHTGLLDILEHLWRGLAKFVDGLDNRLRRIVLMLELLWVNLKGVLADVWDPATGWFDFGPITKLDYRAWIASHGASEAALSSVVVKFFYTGTFANQYPGDQQGGLLSAGAALQFVLASAGYKGGFVYQSRAGTGDTLVMPIYQVLKARGVHFDFFTDVTKVHWSDGDEIEQVDLADQVTLTVAEYAPGIDVAGIPAWPAEPRYDQIDPKQAAKLKAGQVNLESPWADWKPVGKRQLRKGTDFDQIILGIPIKALESICAEFQAQSPEWAAMFGSVKTTITCAAQVYFLPTLAEMGYHPADWGMGEEHCAVNAVTYANPQYSWVDTSQVLASESWPADNRPQVLGLWCGALDDPLVTPPYTDHGYPDRAVWEVQITTRQWIQDNMGWFLPKAVAPTAPAGLDLALIADSLNRADANRQQKWASQYFVANVAPDLRYTLAVPGSNQHRLKADASGFSNLFLCGDWIDFGLNVGYMEGAVISGMQAAQALRQAQYQLSNHQPIWVHADVRPL